MKLNPKLTGGLAWGGLILVLAVPAADMATRPQADSASIMTSDMDQVRTAAVDAPAVKPAAPVTVPTVVDPVDNYVSSGKKLPSYISDAPADVAATKPAPTVKLVVPPQTSPAVQKPPVEVASLDPSPSVIAPQPYPASKRPPPPAVATASRPSSITTLPALPAAEQPRIVEDEPLILDEDVVLRRQAAVSRVLGDDAPSNSSVRQPRRVDGDRLQEWDSGSLADYLESRGMINDDQTAQAGVSDFDDDGFFQDEGPRRERRVIRRLPRNDFFLF